LYNLVVEKVVTRNGCSNNIAQTKIKHHMLASFVVEGYKRYTQRVVATSFSHGNKY